MPDLNERNKYYEPTDPKKVEKVYNLLLVCRLLNNGKNLDSSIRKIVLAARVYLKKPDMLLLDEDFLTVDVFRNRTMYEKLWTMDCTVMSILSDLDNIFLYDRIILLEDGRVVENGNPKYLLKNKNSKLYQRLLKCDNTVVRNILNAHNSF